MSDFRRCTTLMQRRCPTLKQRQNHVTQHRNNVDVGTTLIRFFNLASTLVKAILNPIGPVMIMDLKIDE